MKQIQLSHLSQNIENIPNNMIQTDTFISTIFTLPVTSEMHVVSTIN